MGKIKEFLKGTLSAQFQLAAGIILASVSGVLSVLGSDGSTLAPVAAADPTDDTHLVTKGFADANYGGGDPDPSSVREIVITIGTGATATSTAELPLNAVVQSIDVDVTEAYDGSATFQCGKTGTTNEFVNTNDTIPLGTIGTYSVNLRSAPRASAHAVLASIGGSPTVGAGKVYVTYSVPAV